MTASPRHGVLTHYLRYLGTNVAVLAAGFVSFPVMTRLLDNRQFGILGYYEAWLLVAAAVLKLGTQHAVLRYFPHGGDGAALARFRSNHVLVPFALSLALWACCAGVVLLLLDRVPAEERPVLFVVMLTAPLLIWQSFVESIMYALERSDITMWLKTAWRWSELVLVLLTIWAIERSALGVLSAKLAVVFVVAMWLTWWFRRWLRAPLLRPDRAAILGGFAFGVPMMFNELTTLLFGFADRILLRTLTADLAAVGIYTVGYGLAMSLTAVLGQTLNQAFTPTAIRLYETEGAPAVVALKRSMLDAWVVGVGIGSALLLCVGEEFLIALAGPTKAASAPVFVATSLALVWYSLFSVAQYGLLLQRRATRFLMTTLAATVLNILLNIPLIRSYGIMGAVAATVISYAFLSAVQVWQCPRELRYLPPLRRVLPAVAFAPAMLALLSALDWFGTEGAWSRLFAGSAAVLVPALAWIALDRGLRDGVMRVLAQRRATTQAADG